MAHRHTHFLAFLSAAAILAFGPCVARASGPQEGSSPAAVSGLSGVTFLTSDFAPLRRFYGQGAGFTETPAGRDRIRFVVGDRQWIEFQRVSGATWARRFQHVTLEATDLDRLERDLKSRGIFTSRVQADPSGLALQFSDPAGDLIQVTRPWSPGEGTTANATAFSRHLQHFGLAVPRSQAEQTMAFYRDTLGFPETIRSQGPDGRLSLVKFRIPGPGRELIELIFYDPPLNKWAAGAFDHINFEVGTIDDTYQALHKGGIATRGNHLPTVNGEHLWAIDIIDPELTRMEIQVLSPTTAAFGTISMVGGLSAKPMFDGRTLAGWEGNTATWRAEGGAIVGGSLYRRQPYNEFLATTADYGDFELRLQYRVEGTEGFVNGGVQFWSQRVPGSHEVSGYQADLGAGKDGNLYDESRRNTELAQPSPEVRDRALKVGEWNDYRIRAQQGHIEIWLNGTKTVDYTERVPGIPQSGKFALQIHGNATTRVSYRDLEIEDLTSPTHPGS